jgi:hypothetical protein
VEVRGRKLHHYVGTYSKFLSERTLREQQALAQAEAQQVGCTTCWRARACQAAVWPFHAAPTGAGYVSPGTGPSRSTSPPGPSADISATSPPHHLTLPPLQVEIEKLESFINRFGAKASKATQAQSKMKALEKLKAEAVEAPAAASSVGGGDAKSVTLRFPPAPPCFTDVITMQVSDTVCVCGGGGLLAGGVLLWDTRPDGWCAGAILLCPAAVAVGHPT